jgi:CheY-like chemotaxis protein
VKFTAQGGIHISLESHTDRGNAPFLVARIEDTGIGIPKDQLSLLFKPFSQVDSSNTRKFGGTGLGLAICKELAEMLGGTIEVASTPGIGSVFTVSIPYQTAKNPGINEIAPVTIDQNIAIEYPFHIMVAEDNIINQQLAIMTFQNMGYTIDVVNNGQEAVELARTKTFDLIFMDIQMPVLDGVEATKIILSECVLQPVIVALTANILRETTDVCIQAGMMEVIHKPFRLEAIYEILQKVGALKGLENGRINRNSTNENWN